MPIPDIERLLAILSWNNFVELWSLIRGLYYFMDQKNFPQARSMSIYPDFRTMDVEGLIEA